MADEGAQGGQAVALRVPVYVRFPNTNVRAPLLDELELGPQRGAEAVDEAVDKLRQWQEVRDRRGLDPLFGLEVLGPHATEFAPLGPRDTVAAGTQAICIVAHQNQAEFPAQSARERHVVPDVLAQWNVTYSGVNVNSPVCLKRDELVQRIIDRAQNPGELVLLKAPPASGKTSLLSLVGHKMLQQGYNVYYVLLDWGEDPLEPFQRARVLGAEGAVRPLFYNQTSVWAIGERDVVLIDECQRLPAEWWTRLLKPGVDPLPLVVGAATYELGQLGQDSPVAQFVFSFDEIRLTDVESRELYRKYLDVLTEVPRGDDLRGVILGQCEGYTGLIVSSLLNLRVAARANSLTEATACKLILSQTFVDNFSRVWDSVLNLSPEEQVVVRNWLIDQSKPMSNEAVQAKLVRSFYLHRRENGELKFSCSLVYRRLFRALFPSQAHDQFKGSIFDLVLAVLAKIPPNRVTQACERGEFLPRETSLQHLFMLGLCQVLAPSQEIIPEKRGTGGQLDFFINGTLCWGLELVRLGDRLGGHLSRFEPGGAYHGITSQFKIVDFWPHNRSPATWPPHRIVVQLAENFASAQVREGEQAWHSCALGQPNA